VLSVAILEAMTNGLPIICSDFRGNCDLVLPEKGGYLIDLKSTPAYSTSIRELLLYPLKRHAFGRFNIGYIRKISHYSHLAQDDENIH
jgi:glycosyltransferase involved in cell wall biosynthesis